MTTPMRKYLSLQAVAESWMTSEILEETSEELENILDICISQYPAHHINQGKASLIAETITFELQKRQNARLASLMEDLKLVAEAQMQLAQATKDESRILTTETIVLRKFTKGVFWLTVVVAILTGVLIYYAVIDHIERNSQKAEALNTNGVVSDTPPSTASNTTMQSSHSLVPAMGLPIVTIATLPANSTNTANAILGALSKNGITAKYILNENGIAIFVSQTNESEARKILSSLDAVTNSITH